MFLLQRCTSICKKSINASFRDNSIFRIHLRRKELTLYEKNTINYIFRESKNKNGKIYKVHNNKINKDYKYIQDEIGTNLRSDFRQEYMDDERKKLESSEWIIMMMEVTNIYFKYGARSSKKVECLHEKLKTNIEMNIPMGYYVELERNVKSNNTKGYKKTDIVVFNKDNEPYLIFPVKCIMSNYKQNKNNAYENVTGECMHLWWKATESNTSLFIIPINIIFNEIPYLDSSKKITKIEKIEYAKSFKIYEELKTQRICYDVITYIIDVKHNNKIGEYYDTMPKLIGFNRDTPYRLFGKILKGLF